MTKLDWRRAPKKMRNGDYESNVNTCSGSVYTGKELQRKLKLHKEQVEERINYNKRKLEIENTHWKRERHQYWLRITEEDYQKLLQDLKLAADELVKQHNLLNCAMDSFIRRTRYDPERPFRIDCF